jgi:hypothetical protein
MFLGFGELEAASAATTAATTTAVSTATAAAESTAAATTAAAASEGTATAASTAAAALFTRTGFVDHKVAAVEVFTIHLADRFISALFGGHGDEGKPAGALGHAIDDELNFGHLAILGEQVLEVVLRGVERQITDIELGAH